jgi:hypothetical protein
MQNHLTFTAALTSLCAPWNNVTLYAASRKSQFRLTPDARHYSRPSSADAKTSLEHRRSELLDTVGTSD